MTRRPLRPRRSSRKLVHDLRTPLTIVEGFASARPPRRRHVRRAARRVPRADRRRRARDARPAGRGALSRSRRGAARPRAAQAAPDQRRTAVQRPTVAACRDGRTCSPSPSRKKPAVPRGRGRSDDVVLVGLAREVVATIGDHAHDDHVRRRRASATSLFAASSAVAISGAKPPRQDGRELVAERRARCSARACRTARRSTRPAGRTSGRGRR